MPVRVRYLANLALAFAGVAVLAGCHKPVDTGTNRAAGGDVLPGSISDAMPDLDGGTTNLPLPPRRVSAAAPDDASAAPTDPTTADAPTSHDDAKPDSGSIQH